MDKVGRPTGSDGKFKELIVENSSKLVWDAILYDYNIDGNLPKPMHKEYMQRKLCPLLKHGKYHVKIFGRASKSGDAKYNQQLSMERAIRVKKYLLSLGLPESKVPGSEMRAHGEYLSTSDQMEDEIDRSVIIRVARGVKRRPYIVIPITITVIEPPPPPKKDRVPKSVGGTKFKIKHLGSVSPPVGVVSGHLFWIVDKELQTETTIVLYGRSGSPGIAPVTGKGQWVDFTTKTPTKLEEFSGQAEFRESASLFWLSRTDNVLRFHNVETVAPIRVKSGITIGASGEGFTIGDARLIEEPNPYHPRYTYDPVTGKYELD